jgi:hypothetical protein
MKILLILLLTITSSLVGGEEPPPGSLMNDPEFRKGLEETLKRVKALGKSIKENKASRRIPSLRDGDEGFGYYDPKTGKKIVKKDMCALETKDLTESVGKLNGACGCIYECAAKRKDEILGPEDQISTSTKVVEEALRFCQWSEERIPNFSEYQSAEMFKMVASNCLEVKCMKWYFDVEKEVKLTSWILTKDMKMRRARRDTLRKCFPNTMSAKRYHERNILTKTPDADRYN